MATLVWVIVVIVVVAALALAAVVARNRRTAMLRERFGPEYDRAVASSDDKHAAEAELLARQKQRAQFDVKPLPEAERLRFAGEWRELQERFMDEPAQAVDAADALITRVMEARGYPMRDFDTQAELVSVDYPETVENYRFAHAVQLRSQAHQASTEDLREAMLRYRSLFDELLRPDGGDQESGDAAARAAEQPQSVSPNGRHRVTAEPDHQVPEASPTGRADGLAAREDDTLVDPSASDRGYRGQQDAGYRDEPGTGYRDEQIGR
jgi:hypothetical protein